MGPFTAEYVDPMHIRPYVDLPGPEEEAAGADGGPGAGAPASAAASEGPDLAPFARCGTAETAEMPVVTPGNPRTRSPRMRNRREVGGEGAAAPGDGTRERGPARGPDRAPVRARDRDGGDSGRTQGAADQTMNLGLDLGLNQDRGQDQDQDRDKGRGQDREQGAGRQARGRVRAALEGDRGPGHRAPKRRRTPVALAAAGVAAALGAGFLFTQTLSGGGDDRHFSTDDRALPDEPTAAPTRAMPSPSRNSGRDRTPSADESRDDAAHSSRAARDSAAHTKGTPDASGDSPSRPRGGSPSGTRPGSPSHTPTSQRPGGGGHTEDPGSSSPRPSGPTLRVGSSGSAVADLQRRLKQCGFLGDDAPEDGKFSAEVRDAVSRYQANRHIRGDKKGEYGPYTRRFLESHTPG